MTSLMISDRLATAIAGKAADRTCSAEDLIESMLDQLESDDEFAERMLTPRLRARFASDLSLVDRGQFLTEEEVDAKFEAIFEELEAR